MCGCVYVRIPTYEFSDFLFLIFILLFHVGMGQIFLNHKIQ